MKTYNIERERRHRYHHHQTHYHNQHNNNNNRKYQRHEKTHSTRFSSYSNYSLSNVWMKILKFSFAFNIVNLGSSVNARIHVPNKDNVSNMILKLPMVCKYTVMQTCRFLYENLVWLAHLSTCFYCKKSLLFYYSNCKLFYVSGEDDLKMTRHCKFVSHLLCCNAKYECFN